MQTNPDLINNWAELLWAGNMLETNPIGVKRAFAWIAGGVLPIISLGFWHLLAVFIKKVEDENLQKELQN